MRIRFVFIGVCMFIAMAAYGDDDATNRAKEITTAFATAIVLYSQSGAIPKEALQHMMVSDEPINPILWQPDHENPGMPRMPRLDVGNQLHWDTLQLMLDRAQEVGGMHWPLLRSHIRQLLDGQAQDDAAHADASTRTGDLWRKMAFVKLPKTDVLIQTTPLTYGMVYDATGTWPVLKGIWNSTGSQREGLQIAALGSDTALDQVLADEIPDFTFSNIVAKPVRYHPTATTTVPALLDALNAQLPAQSTFRYDVPTLRERQSLVRAALNAALETGELGWIVNENGVISSQLMVYAEEHTGPKTPANLRSASTFDVTRCKPMALRGSSLYGLIGGYEFVYDENRSEMVLSGEPHLPHVQKSYDNLQPWLHLWPGGRLTAVSQALCHYPRGPYREMPTLRVVCRPKNKPLNYKKPFGQ